MKKCCKCGIEKGVDDFSFKSVSKGKRNSWCKLCMREYLRGHYQNNKDSYKRATRRGVEEKRVLAREYKESTGCSSCGESHPACLQFHHVDPADKEVEISTAVHLNLSRDRIMREIEKCIVLCANCHFKLHWSENN